MPSERRRHRRGHNKLMGETTLRDGVGCPSRTKACRRPPTAYAPASLRLPAAPEARRSCAKKSLASLARCKSLSGKGEPPTRSESCVHGGAVETRGTRWAKRRQRIL